MTHHDRVREQFWKQAVIVNNPTLEVMAAAVAQLSARELRGRPALLVESPCDRRRLAIAHRGDPYGRL